MREKCYAPTAVVESSRLIDTVNPNNSVIFVKIGHFKQCQGGKLR